MQIDDSGEAFIIVHQGNRRLIIQITSVIYVSGHEFKYRARLWNVESRFNLRSICGLGYDVKDAVEALFDSLPNGLSWNTM